MNLLNNLIGLDYQDGLLVQEQIRKTINIEGDICEFGVAQGATSALIADEIVKTNKKFWLFDSFAGLPAPTEKDILKDDIFKIGTIEAYQGKMNCHVSSVKQRLKEISFPENRTKIVAGFIEETINNNDLPEKVSFAFVDFDFYEPTRIVLQFLNNKLSQNGIILIHDYDYFSTGIKTAVDEFFNENTHKYTFEIFNCIAYLKKNN